MSWITEKARKFHIDEDRFSSRVFRNAFKATDMPGGSKWVFRKYIPKAVKNMENFGMILADYAHKHVKLHSAARKILR